MHIYKLLSYLHSMHNHTNGDVMVCSNNDIILTSSSTVSSSISRNSSMLQLNWIFSRTLDAMETKVLRYCSQCWVWDPGSSTAVIKWSNNAPQMSRHTQKLSTSA